MTDGKGWGRGVVRRRLGAVVDRSHHCEDNRAICFMVLRERIIPIDLQLDGVLDTQT